jgi:hypothetical protein
MGRHHYHVGQNIPGYLPESDVHVVETKRAAVALLVDTKRDILDNDIGFHDSPPRATLRAYGNARRDMGYHIEDTTKIFDLGLNLWADVCWESDCHNVED